MDQHALTTAVADLDSVSLDLSLPDYPVLVVASPLCTAKVALHGAHLYEWTPAGQKAVIYTSPTAIYREGKAIRGGVPVCWPWFNAHPTDASLPAHGIGRNRFWQVQSVAETAAGEVTITLELCDSEATRAIWDAAFRATVTITLGTHATIALETQNTGDTALTVGGALHTYLAVGDISTASVLGLDATRYLDTVGTHTQREQDGAVTFSGEVDRIYEGTTAPLTLRDETLQREITVERAGSTTAVVWNPWVEKAQGLGDLPDVAYQDFLCIEAANALTDVHEVAPGNSHTLATTLRVQSI